MREIENIDGELRALLQRGRKRGFDQRAMQRHQAMINARTRTLADLRRIQSRLSVEMNMVKSRPCGTRPSNDISDMD
jgi:hypothetical protein